MCLLTYFAFIDAMEVEDQEESTVKIQLVGF